MDYIPLLEYQVQTIKRMLENKPWAKEHAILEYYNVFLVEDLPATKYDEIIDMI